MKGYSYISHDSRYKALSIITTRLCILLRANCSRNCSNSFFAGATNAIRRKKNNNLYFLHFPDFVLAVVDRTGSQAYDG